MRGRDFHYRWEWRLRASPEQLWPLVTDTNRFNRDAGIPALEGDEEAGTNARRRLRFSKLGVGIEWEEEPFEWVRPYRFSVVRRYLRGPVAEMYVSSELRPQEDGGTSFSYEVRARPRTLLGLVAIPLQIGLLSRRRFGATFREYDRLALAGELPLEAEEPGRLAPGGERRLEAARASLLERGLGSELVSRLVELVERGDNLTLARLRPYVLADAWGAERRSVLELFLHATRVGLLEFRWNLLCPLCRGSAAASDSLADVRSHAHCTSCRIDFGVNFDLSVELAFRPSGSIREVEAVEFCVGGPGLTPHIVIQQLLPPHGSRTVKSLLESGRYRARTLEQAGARPVRAEADGPLEPTLRIAESGWSEGEVVVGESPTLRIENETALEQLLVLERTAWADDAVTAADVSALQLFRDLFATEALRPEEPISVGSLVMLFTDLRDSTRFYREIGDAPAFGSVMEHLDVLRDAVAAEGGAVVKAMGDAIMAVFTRPAAAVAAAMAAQRALASPPEPKPRLSLKAGIHSGPCIAVTQNGRLDYFGSTVNVAARLVGLSSGEDIVVSEDVRADPEVADLVAEGSGLKAVPLEATLKGFEEIQFRLWRLTAPPAEEPRAAAAG